VCVDARLQALDEVCCRAMEQLLLLQVRRFLLHGAAQQRHVELRGSDCGVHCRWRLLSEVEEAERGGEGEWA
jgi:hypothetical protein